MKYDYGRMSIDDICDAYDKMFFPPFIVSWDDKLSNHRQEIIDCIESGIPQDTSKYSLLSDHSMGGPGVDYAD